MSKKINLDDIEIKRDVLVFVGGVETCMPTVPDFKDSDWYKILQDIDKPKLKYSHQKEDAKLMTPYHMEMKLENVFCGYDSPFILEQLLKYWTEQRDKLVKQMEDQNIGATTLIGIDKANKILEYERACWIAINKYLQNKNVFEVLCEKQDPPYPLSNKNFLHLADLPQEAREFELHYGLDMLRQYCGDILDRTYHDRISISDNAVAAMLNDKGIDIDGKSPTTQWKDMALVFTETNHIEFTYDDKMEIIIPSQKTGLKTAEGKYNEEYNSLLKFAIAKGTITKSICRRIHQIFITQKNVSNLRTWLRELTGRNDNPITYSKATGWVCQFSINQNVHKISTDGNLILV
jgi:hypothetical protein